jgi:L-iditol 2-dehydrogenase
MTMKAVYLTGLRRMELLEAPKPAIAAPKDVLLRVDALGVCGSDIHYYKDGKIGPGPAVFPQVLGHELGATVVETGAQVKNLRPGQRVAVDPLIACGECDQCRAGRQNTCRRQKFLGSAGQLPGALVEYMVMPAECCIPVPDSLNDDEVALVEPLSIAVYAVRMAQLRPGERVAVLGSGPIGLCTLVAIHALTDAVVYATDLVDDRLAAARACGAAWAGNPRREDVVAAIQRLEPLGMDAVFECAGEQDALDQGVDLLRPGGALLVIGIPETDRVNFSMNILRRHELRILNVRRQNHCVEPAIELIASGRANVRPLVTHHFRLEETARAFDLVTARRDGVLKAIIRISPEG